MEMGDKKTRRSILGGTLFQSGFYYRRYFFTTMDSR